MENIMVAGVLGSAVLGALGARLNGGAGWQGAVAALLFVGGYFIASFAGAGIILSVLAGVVLAGIWSAAIKMTNAQASTAVLGALIAQLIMIAVLSGNI